MSKKILAGLAPVAAIIAFAMVPAMAQATSLQAPAGAALPVGSTVQGQSANLVTKTEGGIELHCATSEFHGTYPGAGADITIPINKTGFANPCPTNTGFGADITTNAAASPWRLQVQQPEDPNMEQVTMHLLPNVAAGSVIQFTAQLQNGGVSVATCNYKAINVQLMGQTTSHEATLEGAKQFELEANSSAACGVAGEKATLTGTIQFESGANKVFVDMLPNA
jgi:hypothetical protein